MEYKTTGEVLARLKRLGLYVTHSMIEDDTGAHYLPERTTLYRGRAGASGLWEPWMELRAERLYRLRALDRRTRRGPVGNVLRLFLFYADGWGWEYIKETCIQGYRLSLREASRGVKNRLRGQPLTLDNLHAVADDIAEEQYRPKEPNQAQIERVRMTLGLHLFGMAPDGKMGTLEQITKDLMPDVDPAIFAEYKELAPLAWSMISPAEDEALTILESGVTDAVVHRALINLRAFLWRARSMFRRKFKPPLGEKCPSFNPLTGFGAASEVRFTKGFRGMRYRPTPAQLLGAQVAHQIVYAHAIERMERIQEFWLNWVAFWLQSEHCAQWMQRMEREPGK
jgi:hypothetical protein